ncbi:MAG TPA: Hsp20/alpha crystallin family protein [Ktedonobacterales bacterium]|nr:Hsp20/alpha crystallin family protein [Ktedonobacterales bacterium]
MSSTQPGPIEPVDVFTPLRDAVSRLFDEGLSPERLMFFGRTIPVDVIDTPEEYVIEASLTGVRPENVQVSVADNTVTIRVGRKVYAQHDEDAVYLRRERIERPTPEMSRVITLPAKIDPEKVEANYEHGVLTLHIRKSEESKARTIPLHVTKEPGRR